MNARRLNEKNIASLGDSVEQTVLQIYIHLLTTEINSNKCDEKMLHCLNIAQRKVNVEL